MSESVVSRLAIALQADSAARVWAIDPSQPRPPNPYDPILEPAHHLQWQVDFDRQFASLTAIPGTEASA